MPYKNANEQKEYHQRYYLKNIEKINKRASLWQKDHKDLVNKRHREKYATSPEFRAERKEYKRMNVLGTSENGKKKSIMVKKRTFFGTCELCGREIKGRSAWHHWIKKLPETGIWLCGYCHIGVEVEEQGLIEFYRELKPLVENYLGNQDTS